MKKWYKSGNLRIHIKVHCYKGSVNYFYELQAVCGQEHYYTNINDFRGLFKIKSAKLKYLYKILKLSIDVQVLILSCKLLLLAFKKGLEKRSSQGKVSEKSRNLHMDNEWQP